MLPRIKQILLWLLGSMGLTLFAAWVLVSSSLLAKPRGDLAARLLSDRFGQDVEIKDGLIVSVGANVKVNANGIVLSREGLSDANLATVGQLEFVLSLRDLLNGQISPRDLSINAANLKFVVDAEGENFWVAGSENKSPQPPNTNDNELWKFLSDISVQFSNSHMIYQDARNGLDLDLLLASADIDQTDTLAPLVLSAKGALNGEELTLMGELSADKSFKVSADFSQMDLSLEGAVDQEGYKGKLSLSVDEIGQLLDALKLEKSVSGTAQVAVTYEIEEGASRIPELSVVAVLDSGQAVKVTGDLGVLGDPTDISVHTDISLYSASNMPPSTTSRRNLKLTGVVMELVAQPNGIPKRAMVIKTNGFILDTTGEGPPPIEVSKISRTADGKLRLGKAVLRIGPPETPFIVLDGGIADALRLEGIDFKAALDLPAASLVAPELFQTSDALGTVSGGFRLKGTGRALELSELQAATRGTDLWNLNITGTLRNALKFEDIALSISADVPSGSALLETMGLVGVETGAVGLRADVSSEATKWQVAAAIDMDETDLSLNAEFDLVEPHPVLRGQIESDLIRIEHLRQIVAAYIQLKKLEELEVEAKQGAQETGATEDVVVIQPLVLNSPNPSDPAADGQAGNQGPIRNVTLRPLGQAVLMSGLDLGVKIELRKIEGEKGVSSLSSELEMKSQKARLGPMKIEYGGAYFDLTGSIDLGETPDILTLTGSTGGWDFGEMMQALEVKKQANGILKGSFDISGHHTSVSDFLGTATGSATVSMRNGSIDTQLLDLAGLGVIPWLFSKDKGAAVPIVCARAPLYFSNGHITTKQTVVETDQVQLVVYGDVSLAGKSLDLAGQPRKIGKPLSRSPWPFTVVGPFAKPKIKVKDGPRRLARSDGAKTMPQKRQPCVPDILQLQ